MPFVKRAPNQCYFKSFRFKGTDTVERTNRSGRKGWGKMGLDRIVRDLVPVLASYREHHQHRGHCTVPLQQEGYGCVKCVVAMLG